MFTLARRSPFEWMDQVERQMNSMFGRFFEPNGSSEAAWTPACEVYSRDGKIVVRCDVAGVDPGDVHVAVRGRTLTISGERKAAEEIPGEDYWYRGIAYGSFERTVTLPEEVRGAPVPGAGRDHPTRERTTGLDLSESARPGARCPDAWGAAPSRIGGFSELGRR